MWLVCRANLSHKKSRHVFGAVVEGIKFWRGIAVRWLRGSHCGLDEVAKLINREGLAGHANS